MAKGKFTGFGGGGNMNMNNLMKQAQKMKEDMVKLEEEISLKEVESTSGGGAVKVVATGDKVLIKIEIDPDLLDPEEAEMLQDLILVAVNDCIEKAEKMHAEEMAKISGGLGNFPGM